MGINSAVSDTARNFESGEGWEFVFNTDVTLQNIDLLLTNAGGTLTISSDSFSDIVLSGELEGDNDLGNTLVPANTLVSFFYTHTGPPGTDGPRIISLSVAEVVADDFVLGDTNQDGDVDCDDLDGYVGNLGATVTAELAPLDVNTDGTITLDDANTLITTLVQTSNGITGTFPGDLNCDGEVDVLEDAFALIGSLDNVVTSYSQGDINFDGTADVLGDAFVLIANLGSTNDP